ncbi:hypothetical protein A8709_25080 [Paenibacillus pectinilyticus]|uniref:ABC transporter substrate-binding protein n=1 Tax=Paenibacillus pectinilyticus TaxID=512399 RepID=A0A1C1A296_9BACL|nr:extracellular solute-binding protein [Paenibacillus pectinilyticus]OCT14659.1 hypothetical protein A8709_25080 [Paenibacillus pectinilyticus]
MINKRQSKVALATVTCAVCVVTLLAACSNAKTDSASSAPSTSAAPSAAATAKPAEPSKVSIIQQDGGRIWKADNPSTLEIEKKTNTIIDSIMVPAQDMKNKYNVMAASGDIPDISKLANFDYQLYADNGLFLDIGKLIDQYGPNLKKTIKPESWDLVKYKGKTIAIPYENIPAKIVPVIREDWLANVGAKMPTNLDEYEDVLKKFTLNDPDKNGKNDTYGLGATGGWKGDFSMIFGAFGIMPFDSGSTKQNYLKDNKIYSPIISTEYKNAITYIKKLWDEKVIDPEIFIIKGDQANQKLVQSKSGSFTAWWSIAPQVLAVNLKMGEVNPQAKWDPFPQLIKGPDGKSGVESRGSINGTLNISAKAKDPVAAIKLLDYLATDEGWELASYGIKGVHYNDLVSGRTDAGKKAMEEKWLDPLAQIIYKPDLVDKINNASQDKTQIENNRFIMAARQYNLYADIFFGIPLTDDQKTLGPDLDKYEDEMFIKFVTGAEPLSNWDQYVENWKKKGGKQILESRVKKYNELKGTNYTAGGL